MYESSFWTPNEVYETSHESQAIIIIREASIVSVGHLFSSDFRRSAPERVPDDLWSSRDHTRESGLLFAVRALTQRVTIETAGCAEMISIRFD